MRVEQQNANIVDVLKQSIGPENNENAIFAEAGMTGVKGVVYSANKADKTDHTKSVNVKDATYGKPETEEKKSALEAYEEGSSLDATERKNQMVVLSNTTSAEDYAKMQEEGFSLDETTSNTIVTETDKIKAQLAKAGVDISIFGDDLSMEQLEALAGSPELAMQLAQTMQQADLPCTEENMKDAMEAIQLANSLEAPSDGAVKYLLDNEMEPTIENLYKAEYSGNYQMSGNSSIDITPLRKQIERIVCQAGLPVNEETMAESKWMLENEIPLNEENLRYVDALRNMALPVDEQALLESITAAISEGKRPQEAMMISEYALKEQAQQAVSVVQNATDADLSYVIERGMDVTVGNLAYAMAAREAGTEQTADGTQAADAEAASGVNLISGDAAAEQSGYTKEGLALITARRQLEEIRLVMTAEANYALLKKGIQIDTQPLEQLVEELKATENSYYKNLLRGQGIEAVEENVSLFRETTEKVSDLKSAPAYVLGMKEVRTATINEVHAEAKALQDAFTRANERYETLMTAPRADLGDSIQKAFRNVDDILTDLGLETSEANRRAVRILGYNQISITAESVAEMKAVDEEVQRTFHNLTPATVIEMIRRGVNPLDMDFASINETAEQIAAESGTVEKQKFSEFLWKLEQNHGISEEERASYIGTYRLIHQVEQSDGAVIGALVNQGADITMRNLMMAVRSGRHSGKIDYSVDESFGARENSGYMGISITEQIETAYQTNCLKDVRDTLTPGKMRQVMMQNAAWENMTPEQLKEALQQADADDAALDLAYAKEQLTQLTQSASVAEDIYAVLEKYDIPNTMSNILAMEAMVKNHNGLFRQIFGKGTKDANEEVGTNDIEEMKQEVLDAFGEAISAPEEIAEAQEKLGMLAENVMRGMIESDDVTSIDVREMRLMSAQLSIGSALAKEEQYSVPVMVGDGVVSVSLKIVRGVDKKGIVDITMESVLRGKIAATFQAKEQGVTGLVATDNEETRELIEANASALTEGLESEEGTDIRYAYILDLDLNHFSMGSFGVEAENPTREGGESETYQVQTARLYRIAETFIRQIREVL